MQGTQRSFSRQSWLILLLFGLIGQIAWNVENMYFNLFVYDTFDGNLDAVTLMVQLSGVVATVATLLAGVLSDKLGNRRLFISIGYAIWGVTVALFGFISPELVSAVFGCDAAEAMRLGATVAIIGDCVMTLFGSTANDAAFNAWVTDNTESSYRGRIESVISVLPLLAMLVVAGGFGMLVGALGYSTVFLILGILISVSGVVGLFTVKDSAHLKKSGSFADVIYGFRPSVVKNNSALYLSFTAVLIYSTAFQFFMPYLIIYMKENLSFTEVEYSLAFGAAILVGAGVNLFLGKVSDRVSKIKLLYIAAPIMSAGLFAMYSARGLGHTASLILFALFGCVMIIGYIFLCALLGATVRDLTPTADAGKLQGVRMVFAVLIPMLIGPMVGNGINKLSGVRLDTPGADAMTTEYLPAPEIFLAGGACVLLLLPLIPLLERAIAGRNNEK